MAQHRTTVESASSENVPSPNHSRKRCPPHTTARATGASWSPEYQTWTTSPDSRSGGLPSAGRSLSPWTGALLAAGRLATVTGIAAGRTELAAAALQHVAHGANLVELR